MSNVLDNVTRRAIDGELNRWGKWVERHGDYEGFPRVNVLVAATEGHGGGACGHRILCLDMPCEIYAVHGRVLRLSLEEREAVYAWYVIRVKEDGTLWGLVEKCEKIGVNPQDLRTLVNRAKQRIAGL